ncbi:MAG: tripartite tricarboxylate transporter substrate binding protein [Burkholderiales bacterium]|nr:tripartite tricarboxylate transporter substrate binding protein [Burkholderiales bacterium]
MKNPWPRSLSIALAVLAALFCGAAAAQTYPNRVIRLVIPWPAGGATDVTFRLWAPTLAEHLGQQVVVDNRPGAGSTIGLDLVAKSKPDGYTLGATNIAFGANPFLLSKMPFDTEKDFLPVSVTALVPMVLSVHPSVPVRTVKEFVALAKAKPGALLYGSAGPASASHLVGEMFNDMMGTKVLHVPYKGGGPQVIAAVSGEISTLFIPIPNSLQHIRAGKLRALGVSTLKRDRTLSDVPTITEALGTEFDVSEWHGVVVPAGTPRAVITRLHQDIVKVLALPEARERIEGAGAQPVGSTPEEMAAYVKRELTRWGRVIKSVGIKVE